MDNYEKTENPTIEVEQPQIEKPSNNLVWAILATIFCSIPCVIVCLPCGIVSIVKSCKVNSLAEQGFYDEAKSAARKSRIWAIVTAVVGFVGFVINVILGIIYGSYETVVSTFSQF